MSFYLTEHLLVPQLQFKCVYKSLRNIGNGLFTTRVNDACTKFIFLYVPPFNMVVTQTFTALLQHMDAGAVNRNEMWAVKLSNISVKEAGFLARF